MLTLHFSFVGCLMLMVVDLFMGSLADGMPSKGYVNTSSLQRTRLYLLTAYQAEKQIGSDKALTSGPGETVESTFEFGPGVCLDISQTGAEVRCNLSCSFETVFTESLQCCSLCLQQTKG